MYFTECSCKYKNTYMTKTKKQKTGPIKMLLSQGCCGTGIDAVSSGGAAGTISLYS